MGRSKHPKSSNDSLENQNEASAETEASGALDGDEINSAFGESEEKPKAAPKSELKGELPAKVGTVKERRALRQAAKKTSKGEN